MTTLLKYIKSKSNTFDSEKARYPKNFFSLSSEDIYGYPVKPLVVCHDYILNLIAIGTKYGTIKIYGLPGIEYHGSLASGCAILKLLFLQGEGKILALSEENHIYVFKFHCQNFIPFMEELMQFDIKKLDLLKSHSSVKASLTTLKKLIITTMALNTHMDEASEILYIGTHDGDIHLVNKYNFKILEPFHFSFEKSQLFQIHKNSPRVHDQLFNGSILNISIYMPPRVCDGKEETKQDHILFISFYKYYILVWDQSKRQILSYFDHLKTLENVSLEHLVPSQQNSTIKFASSHSDGTLLLWEYNFVTSKEAKLTVNDEDDYITTIEKKNTLPKIAPSQEIRPFGGNKSNKPITHVIWDHADRDTHGGTIHSDTLIFVGGMPKDGINGDKNTVTLFKLGPEPKVDTTFDITSKISDIILIDNPRDLASKVLLVLTEEELLVIRLTPEPPFPILRSPYLVCIHASAITACSYQDTVPTDLWATLLDHVTAPSNPAHDDGEWPIMGLFDYAHSKLPETNQGDDFRDNWSEMFVSGHEDGAIRMWDVSPDKGAIKLLFTYRTSQLFDLLVNEESSPPLHPPAPGGADCDPILDSQEPRNDGGEGPFRFEPAGAFDPFTDDPRLAITKICMATAVPFTSPTSDQSYAKTVLAVAGASGQVIVISDLTDAIWTLNTKACDGQDKVVVSWSQVNLVENHSDNFVWKGHKPLLHKESQKVCPENHSTPTISCCQIYPPAACTTLTVDPVSGLLCAGTAHGFFCLDYVANRVLFYKCTLDPNELISGGDSGLSMKKSLKKSLRQSFRRLRKFRNPTLSQHDNSDPSPQATTAPRNASFRSRASARAPKPGLTVGSGILDPSVGTGRTRGVSRWGVAMNEERSIEARPTAIQPTTNSPKSLVNDGSKNGCINSNNRSQGPQSLSTVNKGLVRCAYLSPTTTVKQDLSLTPGLNQIFDTFLWVGTNSGRIYYYNIRSTLIKGPDPDDDELEPKGGESQTLDISRCFRALKEIQLKHGAPVIHVSVVRDSTEPFPQTAVSNETRRNDVLGGTRRLLIVSEEQIKIFSLPHIKPIHKYRLTALEGSLFRKVFLTNFYYQTPLHTLTGKRVRALVGLTNHGELGIFDLATLRRLYYTPCLRKEDVNGISSMQFMSRGQGFYLETPSELRRISLSTTYASRYKICKYGRLLGTDTKDPDVVSERTLVEIVPQQPEPTTVGSDRRPVKEQAPVVGADAVIYPTKKFGGTVPIPVNEVRHMVTTKLNGNSKSLFKRIIRAHNHKACDSTDVGIDVPTLISANNSHHQKANDFSAEAAAACLDDFQGLLSLCSKNGTAGDGECDDTFYRDTRSILEKGSLAEMRLALLKKTVISPESPPPPNQNVFGDGSCLNGPTKIHPVNGCSLKNFVPKSRNDERSLPNDIDESERCHDAPLTNGTKNGSDDGEVQDGKGSNGPTGDLSPSQPRPEVGKRARQGLRNSALLEGEDHPNSSVRISKI